jgi:hypothetical protein
VNQPEESREKSPKTDAVLMPDKEDLATQRRRRPDQPQQAVEVHGADVQPGPEMTDQPRAGTTEPPD